MTNSAKKDIYVRVKDGAGNDFLCPLDALKEPGEVKGSLPGPIAP